MKAMQMFKIALVVLFIFGGLVGCAKPVTDDQANVTQPDMSQQKEVKVADDKPMHGDAVPSHDKMAGLKRINFDFDQFTLSAEARSVLGENAKYLSANSGVKAVIEGHCDERGSDEYNLALGESRAIAAKNYLVSLGVSAKRLSVISYGEEKPLSNGSGESAWAQNRRAEFKAVN
ncbi:MAG: peptidoglycan-associated lipoprotein Pal [Desulfuromonadales bacterium]|nr:peptidoglycan-associated lipoprotein Pal [Desulfuromonadales bacterium]